MHAVSTTIISTKTTIDSGVQNTVPVHHRKLREISSQYSQSECQFRKEISKTIN